MIKIYLFIGSIIACLLFYGIKKLKENNLNMKKLLFKKSKLIPFKKKER